MLKNFTGIQSKSAESEAEYEIDLDAQLHCFDENSPPELNNSPELNNVSRSDNQGTDEIKKKKRAEKDKLKLITEKIENMMTTIDTEFQTVRTMINDVNNNIEQIVSIIRPIAGREESCAEAIPQRQILVKSPLITNEEEFQSFNLALEDANVKNKLFQELSFIGGNELQKVLSTLCKRLFSKDMMRKYSVVGGRNKIGIQDLNIYQFIQGKKPMKILYDISSFQRSTNF